MRNLRIYLDTTIPNFAFAEDAPDKQAITLELFRQIHNGAYEAYVSTLLYYEFSRAKAEIESKLRNFITDYNLPILNIDEEIRRLGRLYIEEGILPENYLIDSLHIAAASVNNIDYLLSWNYRHIVKAKTRREILIVNFRNGYMHHIDLCSPEEII